MRFQLIILALLLPVVSIPAAPVRVTEWDLQPGAAPGTNGWSSRFQERLVQEVAASLKKLRPDIVILQHAADWETCRQLAQALRPDTYEVATCSSFRDSRGKMLSGQLAILTRTTAYISWSDPWLNSNAPPAASGGFAFAAIRWGDKNVGVFSVQLSPGLPKTREESSRQLAAQIAALQHWKTNRLEAIIVAGDAETSPDDLLFGLGPMGFASAGNIRQPALMLQHAALTSTPQVTRTALAERGAITCEVDLAAPPLPTNRPIAPATLSNTANPAASPQNLLWLATFLAGGLGIFLFARKIADRAASPPLQANQISVLPASATLPYVQIITDQSPQTQSQTSPSLPETALAPARMPEAVRAGVIASLTLWLKQKLVQRLMSDRGQLLATQEAAALKIASVDQRLAKIENQIKQHNQDYERRIDELLKALLTAKEENRELIRGKIALLKAEMEKARQSAAERQQN